MAVSHLAVWLTEMSRLMGTQLYPSQDRQFDWDRRFPVSEELRSLLSYAAEVLFRAAPGGRPIWPPVPSSLYGQFLTGQLGQKVVVITYDASHVGYGGVIQTGPLDPGRLVVGTVPDGLAQVQREGYAGVQMLREAVTMTDGQGVGICSGALVLFRNDCVGALAALRKGSFDSDVLQQHAWHLSALCLEHHIEPLFLHVPGLVLIKEGIDDLSRSVAEPVQGPACNPALRIEVRRLLRAVGWGRLTLDLFASECNALCPRFLSAFAEPGSEGVNAMLQPSWGSSLCPCGRSHRETCFAFPPLHLLRPFIVKARADHFRGIVVTRADDRSAEFQALCAAAVPGARALEGQLLRDRHVYCLGNSRRWLSDSHGEPWKRLVLMAVDFACSSAPDQCVACPQADHRRPRPFPGQAAPHPRAAQQRQVLYNLRERDNGRGQGNGTAGCPAGGSGADPA